MKSRVTKDMIVEAGFSIIREEGESRLCVRNVAARLGCSTQPIMYCFNNVTELREAVLERADKFHTEYLMDLGKTEGDILIELGMNYIRFAQEEKNLFRFIVMSDNAKGSGLAELISSDGSDELLYPLEKQFGLSADQAKDVFEALFVCFHGYAALLAYSAANYDPSHFKRQLMRICRGVTDDIKMGKFKRMYSKGSEAITLKF